MLLSRVLIHELDEALTEYQIRVGHYTTLHKRLPEFNSFDEVEVSYRLINREHANHITSVIRYDQEEQRNGTFRQLIFTQPVNGQMYEINLAKPVEGTKLVTKTIAFITILLLLVVILLSIVLNRLILRKLWRPFYDTMLVLKNFKLNGKGSPDFPLSDIDEFSLLNKSLTEVIDRANDDYRILKEFTENASHELQTPLAIIRSKLDLVIQEEGLSDHQSMALKSAYKGIHRLTKLNQSLLLLAKIENQQFTATEHIDLQERMTDKLSQFMEFWTANNINVLADLQPATINANADLIEILLNNLLSNAGRHNERGGDISISLGAHELSVSNSSTENELDKNRLFNRFYKTGSSGSNNGLGLSIVKQISDQSGIIIDYHYESAQHHFILSW
jgi:signal transduction histidine kinase